MYMDLAGLEELRDALFAASAAFDEGAYLSKTLLNELNEDAVFNLFPPAEAAENDLNAALCSLLRLKETLYDLAKAAGCTLGAVVNIDYHRQDIHVYSEARNIHSNKEAMACSTSSLDIAPDDLVMGDDVSVTWDLKSL